MQKFVLFSLFCLNCSAGVSWPHGQIDTASNVFGDRIHIVTNTIPQPSNFSYSPSGNFTKLSWVSVQDTNLSISIWRAKLKKPPETISNQWSGFSCIAVLPTRVTNFVDKANILWPPLSKPDLRLEKKTNGFDVIITASTNYYWLLDYSDNLRTWDFLPVYYGYGNFVFRDVVTNSFRAYDVVAPQYVTDYSYFIFLFKSKVKELNASLYPINGVSLNDLSSFEMSKIVWLKPSNMF